MNKKNIELAIKNGQEEIVSDFFKNLRNFYDSKKCAIYVMLISGSSGCDSPVISKRDGKYHYDTYGTSFKNWREWERCFAYGLCGEAGETSSLKCVANSCISYNRENGRVALISLGVFDDLKKDGYKIIKLKYGFH